MRRSLVSRLVARMMARSLRRTFRRICWVGPVPLLPPDAPVVVYLNHHNFFDGYLAWLVSVRLLRRPAVTWMQDLHRFPFFRSVGALPFPPGDLRRRVETLRETARLLHEVPGTSLFLFPEARLHRPEEGILPFDAGTLLRLHALLQPAHWLPVALYVTWWGESRPTALITGGDLHDAPDGGERERLAALLASLRSAATPECTELLLEGKKGPEERWNFSYDRIRRLTQ